MKRYFDKYGQEIRAGMILYYEWTDGSTNCVHVVEHNGDLGVLDQWGSDTFISLSTTDLPHARIKSDKE